MWDVTSQETNPCALPLSPPVVLAPYGLSGTLTGVTYKDTDITTQRLLDEWRQFYVLKDGDMREAPEANRVPPAVEVLVGKFKQKSSLIVVLVRKFRHKHNFLSFCRLVS